MAQAARELVETWMRAFNDQDLDTVSDLYAEDCEYVIAARGVRIAGREAQRQLMESFLLAVPDRLMTLRRLTVGENVAVVECDYDGTVSERGLPGMPPRGGHYHRELCCVLEIVDGRIKRERDYAD